LGFNFTKATQEDEFLDDRTTTTTGTRASVGVIIFF
jgi:hypothetical protein